MIYLASFFVGLLVLIKVFGSLVIKSQSRDSVLPLHFCNVSIPDTFYRGRSEL